VQDFGHELPRTLLRSTLAIWACYISQRLGLLRRSSGLFAASCGTPTRKSRSSERKLQLLEGACSEKSGLRRATEEALFIVVRRA
jgi:hypothetical protein